MDFRLTHPNYICRLRNISFFFLIQVGIGTIFFGTSVIILSGYYYYFSVLLLISLASTVFVAILAHIGYVKIDEEHRMITTETNSFEQDGDEE